ncbi:hypothetical protein JDV02_010123 [Purpureocillium takamizusanense]|uniref:Uncharacterized protein n=1 Tax=Purpureocillium takamizusanense TaxID=2060973 RepID=A0A9Q8QS30_9HYPO|nr:uncharacterized protein JDV02_010123 [Purpureocillium takamizusanense]UNI24372.1 hypothetical protein JDV02_010123 [Purpureocillium takamizusanense]
MLQNSLLDENENNNALAGMSHLLMVITGPRVITPNAALAPRHRAAEGGKLETAVSGGRARTLLEPGTSAAFCTRQHCSAPRLGPLESVSAAWLVRPCIMAN